jgi:hypothetical protein
MNANNNKPHVKLSNKNIMNNNEMLFYAHNFSGIAISVRALNEKEARQFFRRFFGVKTLRGFEVWASN